MIPYGKVASRVRTWLVRALTRPVKMNTLGFALVAVSIYVMMALLAILQSTLYLNEACPLCG